MIVLQRIQNVVTCLTVVGILSNLCLNFSRYKNEAVQNSCSNRESDIRR